MRPVSTDWIRAAVTVFTCVLAVVLTLVTLPWMLVPGALVGLFGGGMLVDRPSDDRESRKRVAHRSGLLTAVLVGAIWAMLTDHEGTTKLVLAVVLGAGAGVAALGAALVGMDARGTLRAP